MSAAFALQPCGPPVPCSFPHCIGEAFHEGDHTFPQPKPPDKRLAFPGPRYGACMICGVKFVEYGDYAHPVSRICDERSCAVEFLRRESVGVIAPLMCRCPQRSHRHELSVHKLIRSESYHPQRHFIYPWSLCLAERLEPSTEKE